MEQAWPRFTEEERTEVRAFFADSKPADSLTPSLYAALLGLSSNHAQTFAMQVAQDGLLDIVVESAITRIKVIEYSYYWRPY